MNFSALKFSTLNFSGLTFYLQPRIIAILLLGFSSGLPLALTASTLGVWLTEEGVSKASIGLFAAVATPYALKFLWAPLMDSTSVPLLCKWLGRRRGWMVATQIALMVSLVLLGMASPAQDPWMTAMFALMVAICSASQDIVIDAYRVEILESEQQGAGAAVIVLGYRLGMIISGAGALFLASYVSWSMTYSIMALCVLIGTFTCLVCGEPETVFDKTKAVEQGLLEWLHQAVIMPFADFMKRPHWLGILLFILLYKLTDSFMGVMANPFYLEIGFSKIEIASISKLYGVIATIVGSFIGGWMVMRLGIGRTLWICGIAQMLTNLMFTAQALIGHHVGFLAVTITLENVSGGMGTAAFVAFMSRLCHVQFTATQYALLSSFASFGRTWLSTPAGVAAESFGWPLFFAFSALLGIPALVSLWWLNKRIKVDDV